MSELKIQTSDLSGGVVLVDVAGYLDAHTFEEFDECIGGLFDKGSVKLVVDLAKVDYISSAGAGVFIGNIGKAQDQGGNIILLQPSPNVTEVFELLGLTQIFTLVDDQATAVAQFN